MARIEVEKKGPIGEIRLNRPEVLNAMGRDWPADMTGAVAYFQFTGGYEFSYSAASSILC